MGGCLGIEPMNIKEQTSFNARVTCSKYAYIHINHTNLTVLFLSLYSSPLLFSPLLSPRLLSLSLSFSLLFRAIGLIANRLSPSTHSMLLTPVSHMITSNSCTYKILAALIMSSWKCNGVSDTGGVTMALTSALTEQCVYDEVMPFLMSLQKDCYVSKRRDTN